MLGSKRSGIFGLYNIAYWAAVGSFILLEGTGCMNTLNRPYLSSYSCRYRFWSSAESGREGGRQGGKVGSPESQNPFKFRGPS